MRRLILAMLLCFANTGCDRNQWIDHLPEEYHGRWIETSDLVVAHQAKPQYFTVLPDRIIHAVFLEGDGYKTSEYRFVKANKQPDRAVIFCGSPDKQHIAEKRFILRLEDNSSFMRVSEYVATGYNNEDSIETVGRFVEKK
jgi:hypothetical protein